jgi:ribonuclease HII
MDKKEKRRLNKMWEYENDALVRGYKKIAGIDEAGRGPLAGPVVAAAVILPSGLLLENCNDSKKLSPELRQKIYEKIKGNPDIEFGIGIVSHDEIDSLNILRASLLAMTIAVKNLKNPPDYILVDGDAMPVFEIAGRCIVKGDAKSISIAAASIIAKQTRDSIMDEYDKQYGQYGFAKHKGYGTEYHLDMLTKHGPSPIHRRSFLHDKRQEKEIKLWKTD